MVQVQCVSAGLPQLALDARRYGGDVPAGTAMAQVLPTGPDYPGGGVDVLFTNLIHTARERVVLATPYFIPNEPLLQAMRTASHLRQ